MSSVRPIPWDLYEEHLEEAAFLWGQWERAMDAAHFTIEEVSDGPESRLRAHLDGLVLGGKPVAEKLLMPALTDGDEGKITSAAWALLQAEDADHLELVFDALVKAEKKEPRTALSRAFERAERPDLAERLRPRLQESPPSVQATIVRVLSARPPPARGPGQTPAWGLPLESFLEGRHQELVAAALGALCCAPDPLYAPLVEKALASPYVAVRDAAIEAGLCLGLRTARTACSKLVARNAPGTRLPLAVLALAGEPVDITTIIRKLDVESMRRDALWALGFAGTVQAAEAALSRLGDDAVGRAAAEAFATITGIRISGPLADLRPPDHAPPADDDDDVPVVLPEDSLPAPNPKRVVDWWTQAKARFALDARYLYGGPLTVDALRSALTLGPTWRRRAWMLDLMANGREVAPGQYCASRAFV